MHTPTSQSGLAVALVTGGAHGIGRATSEMLASRGDEVHCVDVDANAGKELVRTIQAAGGNATFHYVDLTKKHGSERAVRKVLAASGGRLDFHSWLHAPTGARFRLSFPFHRVRSSACMRP